eukprot:5915131-Prymnesium_polylepis.1
MRESRALGANGCSSRTTRVRAPAGAFDSTWGWVHAVEEIVFRFRLSQYSISIEMSCPVDLVC